MRPASPFLVCSFARSTAPRVRPWLLERIPTPIRKPIPASRRPFHPPRTSTRTRPSPAAARAHVIRTQLRHESSEAPSSAPGTTSTTPPESRLERDQVPAYELTFTCKVCTTRSSHRISKQGYHKGTILISCPGCKNRHLISDHLKIFSDKEVTLEDIMREKGDLVKRGQLGEGDIEFWEDGTSTPRSAHFHANSTAQDGSDAAKSTLVEPPSSKTQP